VGGGTQAPLGKEKVCQAVGEGEEGRSRFSQGVQGAGVMAVNLFPDLPKHWANEKRFAGGLTMPVPNTPNMVAVTELEVTVEIDARIVYRRTLAKDRLEMVQGNRIGLQIDAAQKEFDHLDMDYYVAFVAALRKSIVEPDETLMEAKALGVFRDAGNSIEEIAEWHGMHKGLVRNRLYLLLLTPEEHKQIRNRTLKIPDAVRLAKAREADMTPQQQATFRRPVKQVKPKKRHSNRLYESVAVILGQLKTTTRTEVVNEIVRTELARRKRLLLNGLVALQRLRGKPEADMLEDALDKALASSEYGPLEALLAQPASTPEAGP
jgi:hypothetical protein